MSQSNYLDFVFESDKEERTPERELLPMDRYTAEIAQATAGPTKNGKGYGVNIMWRITEGPHEGRTVFQSALLQHDNPDVMQWGRGRFKDILVALDITGDVQDLGILYNKPAKIVVKVKEDKTGQYGPKNEVVRVISLAASRPYAPIYKKDDPISSGRSSNNDLNDSINF
jgi:hypothetical protein